MTDIPTSSTSPKAGLLQVPQGLSRPHSSDLEFDSGINTSAAWTVSLTNPDGSPRLSLNATSNGTGVAFVVEEEEAEQPDRAESVDEEGSLDAEQVRPARALYTFQGKAEFRELTSVEAGDDLEIVREDVGEGWSLARLAKSARDRSSELGGGEIGLIPRSYYIVRMPFLHPMANP